MADGDPMVLQTISGDLSESLLNNGPIELWSGATNVSPDGWECTGVPSSVDRDAFPLTGAPGAYSVIIADSGMSLGGWGNFRQIAVSGLNGSDSLPSRGHKGQSFVASIRHKLSGTAALLATLWIYERNSSGSTVASHYVDFSPTGTPQLASQAFTISHDDCVALWYVITITVVTTGYMFLAFDDAQLYRTYTFAANPSMPDQQSIFVPNRKFGRDAGGKLYRARGATNTAKFQKQLNFNLIGLAQYKALRSLWLLDVPCRWTPNHPHLPSSLDVRLTDDQFNFSLGKGGFGSNIYRGSLELSEI